MCGISKKLQKIAKYSCLDRQVRHQYLNNANYCNFFDNIPQILRVKASIVIVSILIFLKKFQRLR